MFRNNVVGDWYAAEREEYNPDGVMSFVGDTLHGIGQSAVLFIPYAGAPLFYTGIVSQGVSSAAAITGEVGLKEIAYGVTTGALEGVIDKALGGTASTISNAVKGIGKNAGKSTGKALFKATTDASRKGLMRKILSSGASEFAEEFVSEYADTLVQRAYRIDPTKQYSLKDAIYSGFVGMTSGMVTTSAVEIPRSINYAKKGRSIIDRGNSQTLVNTATVVADKLANKGTNFKNAAGWVTALRGQVDAYNDLVKKGKGDSASAATILGEMQAYLSYAETKAVHAGLMEKIEKASDEDKAALAEYINMLVDKENRKKDYTAEDITNNTDEIASQLAIMQFAGMALNYESITEDVMREKEISEAIANERNASTEEAPAATVEDAAFDQAMAMTEETPAQVAETVEIGQAVDTESAPAPAKTAADIKRGIKNATNKIEVQGKLYEISEANIDDISNRAENLIKSGVSETDAVAQAIDEGLSDIRSLDEGGKLSPVFAKARIAKIKGAIINAYRQDIQNEAKKAAREAKLAEDTETHKTEETATEEKIVPEAETKTEAPNTSNYTKIKGAIVPNKSAQATKTKEAPKQQNTKVEEKSSDRTNESSENKTEPPKVSEAKESLTDEQRAERARKKAKEMLEWELNNTPTVNELNTAREYVKGFDNLSPERRQSIIRMMRTTKGIDVKIVKGIANLMAIKAGTDLDLRFDEEVSEYGVSVKSEGRTLIIISSKTDFKETVEGTVVHELVHYLENKSGYKAFAEHVMKRVKPEKKAEIEKEVTERYNEHYKVEYRSELEKQGLTGKKLDKALAEKLASEEHKALIESEVVAELVGQALNSDKFLSRYARIGNTDGFIKKAYTFLRAMVKELKSKDKENNELADIIMPTIKSMDRLLQMGNASEGAKGKKYLFAGDKAKTADKMKLATAKEMLESGADSETVRRETGWFKGYDGKWRFEIDDFESGLIENPKLEWHEDDGEVYFTGKISDIFDHKELFAAYPDLKDINVVIQKTELGVDAIYQPKSNYITLSIEQFKRHTKAYHDYLDGGRRAEIKRIEASEAYKEYNKLYDDAVMDEMKPTEWLEAEKAASEKFYSSELGKRYYQLMWGKDGFVGDKFEFGWSKAAKETLVHELQHAVQKREGFASGTNTRDANYDRNAGEIEARDAAHRANMTSEQRKNTRPNIDREDVVFADKSSVSYFAANNKNAENESTKEQLRNHLDEVNAMEPVANVRYQVVNKQKAKQDTKDFYKSKGYKLDRQNFGVIEMGESEVELSSNYANTAAEFAAWMTVPNVLKRGKLISGHYDHKGEGFPTYTFAAPVVINGQRGNVAVVVRKTGKYRYKMHRILMPDGSVFVYKDINENAELTGSDILLNEKEKGPDISSASTNSIPQKSDLSTPSAKKYSLAPKKAQTNAKEEGNKQNAELDEKGEVIDPYFENAYLRSNLAEAEKRYNALLEEMQNMQMRIDYLEGQNEEYTEGGSNLATLLKEAYEQKQGYEFIVADLKGKIRQKDKDLKNERRKTKYQKDIKENYAEQLKHEEEKYLKLLEEGTKQKNFDFIEIFELRARLRELGYDFEAERKKAERLLEQNDKQKEMIKEGKKEIRMAQAIVEVRTREAARLAKELAKRREEFGKYYSATPIKREVMNIVERGDVSKLFGGTYTPTIEGVSANDIAEYIAINLNIKGDDGKVANNIVRVAAENLIQKMKFIDSESGEVKYLENIVDADTYKLFVAAAKGEIAEMIKNAGTVNPYSKLVRDYEKKIAQYVKEEEQSKERKAYGEQLPKTYQEALKMRKLEKRGAAGFSENIEALAKKFAGLVDESGHLHLSRIDDAMNVLSEFIAKEELKNADERTRLKIDDAETMTDFASDDAMLALLKALVENYKHNRLGTNPSQMQTAEDLKNVEEIIKVLRKYVEEYGKEYFNGHYVDSVALAEQAVKNAFEVSKGRAYKTKVGELLGTNLKKLGDAYFYRILTPETVIETLEGFEKDGVLTKLYHQIRVASDKRNTMAMRMTKPFVEFFESKEHRWQDKGLPMSYDRKLRKKMISINGTDIRLDDAIYLYCLTKDPDSYVGLAENGFITYNEDGQREHTIKIEDIERTRSNIANQFDDVDVEFVKLVEGFFNGTATKIKYDADVKIFGVSNNRDTYYIPIYRYKYARMRNVADARASIAETITVFNKSFTHNRVANNTAIESSGIANIIYTHANSLADYSELYLPLKAFDRIYNRAVPLENGEIRSARDVMNNQVWKGTDQFLQDLFKDIQGQGERRDNALESAVGAIRGFWVSSLLGANLKVCTTQLTSLVSATQVIDPKYITMASPKVATPDKALGERADKYSDIIEERSFDNEAMKAQGNLQKIGKIGKITGMGIEFVDRRVCLTIFHAAELQVQDQKGYAVGTEENARLAAKLADETIRTTQSMSDAAEKSALQRSKSEIGKLFSMFTSDTVKNLSHAYGNVMKYMAHKRRAAADPDGTVYQEMLKKDAKDLRRSARTLLMTGVMLGLIAQGFKWLYDELEDDPEERQKDFAMDIASSTLNIFPVASDFIDKLVLGYDMSLNVLDVANDTIDAIKNGAGVISRSMSGEYVSKDEIKRAASNAGTRLISFFGIPIEPARRTVTGLIRRFSPETIYGYDTMRYGASCSADIQAAIESGDDALAEAVIEQLYKDEATGTYSQSELEEVIRLYSITDEDGDHYNVLPRRVLKKMEDGTELNAAQRKQFNSIYSQASAKVNELIRSEEYKMLDDKAKAKAIRDTYELYYNRAAAEVVGKEWSANQAYSKLTDNYTVLMASKAYKSSLEAYKTDSGKEVTVKEQFSQYVKNLNLSDNDYLIVAYANGYKGKKTTRALLKYINSLDLNEAEKQQIAKALNFDLKNGRFTEKED